jgi:hypothetical protein
VFRAEWLQNGAVKTVGRWRAKRIRRVPRRLHEVALVALAALLSADGPGQGPTTSFRGTNPLRFNARSRRRSASACRNRRHGRRRGFKIRVWTASAWQVLI